MEVSCSMGGYEPDEDSWLNWNAVKDLATSTMQETIGKDRYLRKRILFSQVLEDFGFALRKLRFTKLCAKPLKGVKNYVLVI